MITKMLTQISFEEIKEGDLLYSSGQICYFSTFEDYNKFSEQLQIRKFNEFRRRREQPSDIWANQKILQSKTPIFIINKTRYYCESIQNEKVVYIPNDELKQSYLIKME
jgi:hypothetical protein